MHCLKNIRFLSFSGAYSDRMWENTDQKYSKYGHFHAVMVMKFFIALHFNHLPPDLDISFQIPEVLGFLILTASSLFLNS